MRPYLIVAASAVVLAACHRPAPPAPAAAASTAMATPEQLSAEAARDEAEAARLEAQAGVQAQPPAQAAPQPAAAPADAGGPSSAVLGPSSQKLNSGEYYESISFPAEVGQTYNVTYDTQGYRPAMVVLDANNQIVTRSISSQQGLAAYHLETEIKPDSAGVWRVLLSEADAGATGRFTVNLQKITETTIN